MESDLKVFYSDISRVDCETENHLYDLLKIETAVPVSHHSNNTSVSDSDNWEFTPNKDKTYSPKHVKSKLKVSTVSDIRTLFEKDVSCYLPSDLEHQQNYLLRKIRDGSSSDEKTTTTALALLNGENPISRRSWHMLCNINPEKHKHPKQYVLWHGKCIQVNGSRGGKNTFICNHDLNKTIQNLSKSKRLQTSVSKIRKSKCLLRNSVKVKFKPGPLGKKKFLDGSHQKYQMGDIELVTLPAPCLEISPTYGIALEPTIANFINNLRGEKGEITEKYAEVAVSVLGSLKNNTLLQIEEEKAITFDLNYKCEQNRILMRRNYMDTLSLKREIIGEQFETKLRKPKSEQIQVESEDSKNNSKSHSSLAEYSFTSSHYEPMYEIMQIMNDMLNCVEISLNQDSMYVKEDELRNTKSDDTEELTTLKEKPLKRKHCELNKLDVTIIKIPESSTSNIERACDKAFCTKGCVCDSLDCVLRLKQHCGAIDCMFGCKCEVSKYKNIDIGTDCNDIMPGILNLNKEINSHLAKEEQEFHQTIVVSGEKSIVLKSRKRNWKCSNKYADFYSKMNLKGDEKLKKILTVDVERLPHKNIEPLCMVHCLYKCFCKGKFTESYVFNTPESNTNKINNVTIKTDQEINKESESCAKSNVRSRLRKCYEKSKTKNDDEWIYSSNLSGDDEISCDCARTLGYHGRKYSKQYYTETNRKILEMEKNDSLLKKKMLRLVNGTKELPSPEETETELLECETVVTHDIVHDNAVNRPEDDATTKAVTNKNKEFSSPFGKPGCKISLKQWLETSYKYYKDRLIKGLHKNCLEAPRKGKAALQSWDFILSRYRERKNIFFVSKTQPFRTFLAVDDKHQFFIQHCKNIDDIRFADLPQYPLIIRNLVTNSTDSENSFCILRGWDHCWELIGSAVKVIEHDGTNDTQEQNQMSPGVTNDCSSDSDNNNWFDRHSGVKSCDDQDSLSSCSAEEGPRKETVNEDEILKHDIEIEHNQVEKSKWFVMQIENDFTEIQFYKKGFYVTYEGIQRSINLARISGKTVRLSSRARADKTQNENAHQYGIYAIPCVSECCVFIGPYDINEPLGLEVVKPHTNFEKIADTGNEKKTRGVWINTNKLENSQVIDNPLAYLPSGSSVINTWMDLDRIPTHETSPNIKENEHEVDSLKLRKETLGKNKKQIKPIKIRRSNGFYHLTPDNVLHKIWTNGDLLANNCGAIKTALLNPEPLRFPKNPALTPSWPLPGPSSTTNTYIRPVAEIAPQIKITNVYSEKQPESESGITVNKTATSMLILKPEEINKKILAQPPVTDDLATDIETFLETSTICIAPKDVLVISDDEDEPTSNEVWIECRSVESFGHIRAVTKDENENTKISFEFPGFKYSEYYEEPEAFHKINQVLARKIFIPRYANLQWEVVRDRRKLTSSILTAKHLEDKKYLLTKLRQQYKEKEKEKSATMTSNKYEGGEDFKTKDEQVKFMQDLEDTSRELEHQNKLLWNEAVTRRNEICESLSVPDNVKEQMSDALKMIMSLNDH